MAKKIIQGLKPHQIKRMTAEAVENSYKYLRRVALKRLDRLVKAGYGGYRIVTDWFFPPYAATGDPRGYLTEVSRFLDRPESTLTGMKERNAAALENFKTNYGFDFVNENNLQQFYDLLNYAHDNNLSLVYDSGQVYELFQQMERKKISAAAVKKNFDFYMNNLDRLEELPASMSRRRYSHAEVMRRLHR